MKTFLFRFRWAIILAVLQGTIFAAVGLSQHRQYHRDRNHTGIENFGCFILPHHRLSSEERSFLADVDCWPSNSTRVVVLTNFPVFMVWNEAAKLTADKTVDEFLLFYVMNGIGIPTFWFCMGLLIDWRCLKRGDAQNPPKQQS